MPRSANKRTRRNVRRSKAVSNKIHRTTMGYRTHPGPNPRDIIIAPWNSVIVEDSQKGDKDYSFEGIARHLCQQLGLQTGTSTKVDLAIDIRVLSFQLWGLAAEKPIQVAAASSITGEYIYLRDFPGRNQFSAIGYVFPSSFAVAPQQSSTPTWKTNVINIDAGEGQLWLIRIKCLWRANNTSQITRIMRANSLLSAQTSNPVPDYEMI